VAALETDGIVSLGGGAVLNEDTQSDLGEHRVVLVTASPEAIAPRLDATSRPLLTGGIDAWITLAAARQPIYDLLADIVVDTSRGTMESHADALAERLRHGS
jgi:shikimate kinase